MYLFRAIINRIKFYIYKRKLSATKRVDIMKKTIFHDYNNISFKNYVYIGPSCEFMASGGIEIGSNVIFGPRVKIWTENHNYKSSIMVPYDNVLLKKKVIIHDNVWVGYDVLIAPGSEIGEGSIIGMGSVVRGKVPPLSIVIGNPAQIISRRDEQIYNDIVTNSGFYYIHKKANK